MRRREFLGILATTALCPLAARARQPSKPVVGYLYVGRSDAGTFLQVAFRAGLKEAGCAGGGNGIVEYRWAEGHFDRRPRLPADLCPRQVTVPPACGA